MVVGFDVAAFRGSQLWQQVGAPFAAKIDAQIDILKNACGFDPTSALTTGAFGFKGVDSNASGILVLHGVPKGLLNCATAQKKKLAKAKMKVVADGDIVTITYDQKKRAIFGFVDDATLVAAVGAAATKQQLLDAEAGTSGLPSSPAFLDLLQHIRTTDTVWFAINGNAPFMYKSNAMGVKFKALLGSVQLTDALALELVGRMSTADEANSFATMAKGQFANAQVQAMFDHIDISTDGGDAKLELQMSAAKLQALLGMLAGLMP
jgi:hypothetical protein